MDINQIKNKLKTLNLQGSQKEKVDFTKVIWKPKEEGKYTIRFVSSKFKEIFAENEINPFKEMYLHYGIGKFPIFALTNWSEKDPIVEFAKQLKASGDKEDWKLSKKLEPKMRVFAPIIVRGEEEKGVRLWEFGKATYSQLLGIAEDEDFGDFTNVDEGFDFTLKAVISETAGRKGLKSTISPRPKSSPLSTDPAQIQKWLNEQPNILEIQKKHTFEELKTVLQNFISGNEEAEEATEGEPVEVPQTNYAVKAKPKSKAESFDELFEDEK